MKKVKLNKNIRRAFFIYVILFTILFLYIARFMFIKNDEVIHSSLNPRVNTTSPYIERGDFYSSDLTKLTNRNSYNQYLFNDIYAHIIGYNDDIATNLEATMGLQLLKPENKLTQSLNTINSNNKLKGNSVVLTINNDLQNYINLLLKDKTGSILVLDTSKNKVLAMDSSPSFNPNDITLAEEESAFFNRVTQGFYTPSSFFKIVSALTFMKNYEDFNTYTYECTGEITKNDVTIPCINNTAHGVLNLNEALTHSCNSFFVSTTDFYKPKDLINTSQDLWFNKTIFNPLNIKESNILEINNDEEFYLSAIGKSNINVTPTHLSMLYSSMLNNGNFTNPTIIKGLINYKNENSKEVSPNILSQIFTNDEILVLNNFFNEYSFNDNIKFYGKDEYTIINESLSQDIFIGHIPKENTNILVTILYENTENNNVAIKDAKKIFEYIYKN